MERLGSAKYKEFREASETVDQEIHSIVTQGFKEKIKEIDQWIEEEDQKEVL